MKTRVRKAPFRSLITKLKTPRKKKDEEPNWQKIREAYEQGHNPEILASHFNVFVGDIMETAFDEDWNLPLFNIDKEGRYVYNP